MVIPFTYNVLVCCLERDDAAMMVEAHPKIEQGQLPSGSHSN